MTNGELIALLSKHPDYAEICAQLPDWDVPDCIDVGVFAEYGGSVNGPHCSIEIFFRDPYEKGHMRPL